MEQKLMQKRENNRKYAQRSRTKTNDFLTDILSKLNKVQKNQEKILHELDNLKRMSFQSSIIESFDESLLDSISEYEKENEHQAYIDGVNAMLLSTNRIDNTFEPPSVMDRTSPLPQLDLGDFEKFHSIRTSDHATGTMHAPIHVE